MNKEFKTDKLYVKVFNDRTEMGKDAAKETAALIAALLKHKPEINMIFAAAPSQDEFLRELISNKNVEWDRINAFHMDEYAGLPPDAPQSFGVFLRGRIFGKVNFKSVNYMDGTAVAEEECARYAALLKKYPPDIICMGIGENGHIAFNDPHVAFFNDPQTVKIVELDKACRRQQVNDGCFPSLDAVPAYALTLTIPVLMSAAHIVCVVPGSRKADAVKAAVQGEISEQCPASILRKHDNAVLYCDKDSGIYIT